MTTPGTRTASRPVVAGCGAIAVDKILVLDRDFHVGKGRILRREVAHGGNIATALAAAGTLGGNGRWLGYLSSGEQWAFVREDLVSHGIDISAAEPSSWAPIRSTILVQPGGDRFIAFDDQTLIGAAPGTDVTRLDGADVLLVDTYAAANGLPLVDRAAALGIPVVVDLERADDENARLLLQRAQHLVIPLEAARSIVGDQAPHVLVEQLWNTTRHAVVITDGANGAWFKTEDDAGRVPAFVVDVIDTSGCGDVFHGAYALAIASGETVRAAVRFASAAAAVCATGIGGRGHLPTATDVQSLLRH